MTIAVEIIADSESVETGKWNNFFLLRTDPGAEPTMQALAKLMKDLYENHAPRPLERGEWHLPYYREAQWVSFIGTFGSVDQVAEWLRSRIPTKFWGLFSSTGGNRSLYRAAKIGISAARCARTSYNNFSGRVSGVEEDIELAFGKLIKSQPYYASPLEHRATPDWQYYVNPLAQELANLLLHGNLVGRNQARKFIPGEGGSCHV